MFRTTAVVLSATGRGRCTHLSLKCDGGEGLVSLHDADEQADPGGGAEGGAHVRREGDAADEAQRAPVAVLLPPHQALRRTACRGQSGAEQGGWGGFSWSVGVYITGPSASYYGPACYIYIFIDTTPFIIRRSFFTLSQGA